MTDAVKPALHALAERFAHRRAVGRGGDSVGRSRARSKAHGLKMPKLAMPLRVMVFGTTQTPSIFPTLALAGKARVLERLRRHA